MRNISRGERIIMVILTFLCIVCFPLNPLVLAGIIEPAFVLTVHIAGWIAWAAGMVLVMAPIVLFPIRGGVRKGQSFVHTSKLVTTGVYAVVRHPQYLGGILAIFLATPLLYPHWLFAVLAVPGIIIMYWSALEEDKQLIRQFGDEYRDYASRVPRMNLPLGIIRLLRKQP